MESQVPTINPLLWSLPGLAVEHGVVESQFMEITKRNDI